MPPLRQAAFRARDDLLRCALLAHNRTKQPNADKKITDGICAGHSFCRGCLLRALDHMNRCPVCRTILHTRSAPNPIPFQDFFSIFSRFACLVRSAQNHPISTSLQSVLSKHFAAQTAERAKEDKEDVKSQPTVLPLFITDFVLPGQVRYLACPDPLHCLA